MGELSVVLREAGHCRVARVHKNLLNAFQDMRWFAPVLAHPLERLFVPTQDPPAPVDYG